MDELVPHFVKQGMVGLVFGLLVLWIIRLLFLIDKRDQRIVELTDQLMVSADKRIDEARGSDDVIRGNMTALATLSEKILGLEKTITQVLMRARR